MKTTVVAVFVGTAVVLNAAAQGSTGTAKPVPAQVAQIQKQIELLKVHTGASPFLNIQEKGGEAIIQLARVAAPGNRKWSLNIAYYPSKEKPAKALAAVGMTLPVAWQEEQFEAGTFAQYAVPESDLPKLPQFIHDLFVKLFKRPASYQLDFSIETDEPLPKELTNVKPEIKISLGEDKRMKAEDSSKTGQVVTFNGIVSTMKQNGRLTEVRIGNMDDNMKSAYGVVLDDKGKQLAELGGAVNVKGHIEVKNGKKMLVVEEFRKFTNTK
jgi:hypothetical protein